jgi:regulator of protease activity HflC (stomatin/prohibitin superfamily)
METRRNDADTRGILETNIPTGKIISVIITLIIVFLLIVFLFSSVYIINAGERGVVLSWGKPQDYAVTEGIHFKVPVRDEVVKMDIKTQKYEAAASAASKDLQVVSTSIAVNFHLEGTQTPILYKEVGVGYADRIIQPAVQEVVKSSTAKFNAEELITKRNDVKQQIQEGIKERLSKYGIVIEEISITNFDFSPSFNAAIEAKVVNEQNALASKNKLEQVKYEAEQRIVQAQAEAEAIKIQAQSINSQGGSDYVQLQAINKWNGIMPTYVGGGATPFIDLSTIK